MDKKYKWYIVDDDRYEWMTMDQAKDYAYSSEKHVMLETEE